MTINDFLWLEIVAWQEAMFVDIDQLSCYCVFIYSNFHWHLVTILHDGILYCFCLLAKPYETINQSINNPLEFDLKDLWSQNL